MGSRSRQSALGFNKPPIGNRGESSRAKDKKESPPVPDSTTEPAPRPAQKFQDGDDVFYQTDTGQQMLGTVGEVRGQSCVVQFGDGTEQLAPFKRLKKLFPDFEEADESKTKRKKSEPTPAAQSRPQQTCGSCGVSRRISAKKAKLYEEDSRQFECRRCVKQSQSPNSPPGLMGPFLQNSASNSLKGKLPPDISITPMGSPSTVFCLPSTSSPHALKSKSLSLNSPVSIPRQIQFSVVPSRQHLNTCFNCESSIQPFDRVHCNMCEKPCHLMCLSLNPPPLSGDKFWDLLCSSCGNQNTNEKVKVFSVRRNINSWADVACLLISCLSVTYGQGMFELESEILPFLERNMERLHLPRMYKSPPSDARQKFILNALTTSRLRFENGRDTKKKLMLWGLKSDQFIDSKKLISCIASEMGLKKKMKTGVSQKPFEPIVNPIPFTSTFSSLQSQLHSSPDLLRFINSTKIQHVSPSPTLHPPSSISKGDESDTTTTNGTTESCLASTDRGKVVSGLVKVGAKYGISTTNSSSSSTVSTEQDKKTYIDIDDTSRSSSATTGTNSESSDALSKRVSLKKKRKRKNSEGSNSSQKIKKEIEAKINARLPLNKRTKVNDIPVPASTNSQDVMLTVPKLIIKTPVSSPRKVLLESSNSSDEDDYEENMTLQTLKLNCEEKASNASLQRAIKTGTCDPSSASQVKQDIEGSKEKGKAVRGKGRPKQIKSEKEKEAVENSSIRPRLRTRGRGRPPGIKASIQSKAVGGNGKTIRSTNGVTFSKNGTTTTGNVPIVSRRVGTFNSISERRPVPNVIQDSSALNLISETLFDAAMHGYRMQCLPRSPQSDIEKRNEALKVFSHFRTEKENEVASFLLGRSETETRSQTRRKSELFVGSQKRDLNDFDSYEVIGKRVDPDGVTRYQVLWKRQEDYFSDDYDEDFLEEDEKMEEGVGEEVGASLKLSTIDTAPKSVKINTEFKKDIVEECENYFFQQPEDTRSVDSLSIIDLTNSP